MKTPLTDRQRLIAYRVLFALAILHSIFYTALLVTWLTPPLHGGTVYFGWAHGITWIVMSLVMLVALRLRIVQWSLALMVCVLGPLIPFVGVIGFVHFRHPPNINSASD